MVKNKLKPVKTTTWVGVALVFYNSGTLAACFLGGGILIGASGKIYSVGLWDDTYLSGGAIILIGGFLMCLFMAGTFYILKLWRVNLFPWAIFLCALWAPHGVCFPLCLFP